MCVCFERLYEQTSDKQMTKEFQRQRIIYFRNRILLIKWDYIIVFDRRKLKKSIRSKIN
jgi:hypothetical protein